MGPLRGDSEVDRQSSCIFFSLDVHSNSFLDLMLIEIVFFSCGNTVEHGVEKNVRSWFCSRSGSCSFFYSKCKYTLGIFFWDSFSMLHGHSLRLQDLRREATLSAFFSGIVFSCCMLTL